MSVLAGPPLPRLRLFPVCRADTRRADGNRWRWGCRRLRRHAADLPKSQAPASNGRMRGMGRALLAGGIRGFWPCLLALHRRQRAGRWSLHAARRCPCCSWCCLSAASSRMPPGSTRLALLSGVLDMMSNVLFILAIGTAILPDRSSGLVGSGRDGRPGSPAHGAAPRPPQVGAALAVCSVLLLAVS